MKLERIPHDQFFKRMMSDSRVAKAFFAAHLPEKVKHNILLDSLKMESTSFISRELAHHESDMLYQVKLKNNKVGFIYLLIEHQSRVDELMPFRMLRYIVRIIERYLRQHHNKLPLPLVFPMVFY
ncbi:MAG: Rpn family recombination-promoting nuclease/putative transposase, partial [Gammaproteobacteria bacterium]